MEVFLWGQPHSDGTTVFLRSETGGSHFDITTQPEKETLMVEDHMIRIAFDDLLKCAGSFFGKCFRNLTAKISTLCMNK